jgi:peroxiredoxin Q/BCP
VQAEQAGITIIGVSGNNPADHQRFRNNQQLNFPLASDTEGQMCKAFGTCPNFVPGIINFFSRVAFLVNEDGTVAGVFNIEGPEAQINALMDWVTAR